MATLSFDSARYVGARIGIFDPSGRKVGRVSHLSNQELVVIAGEPAMVRRVVEAVGTVGEVGTVGAAPVAARPSVLVARAAATAAAPLALPPTWSPLAWWIGYNRQREQA